MPSSVPVGHLPPRLVGKARECGAERLECDEYFLLSFIIFYRHSEARRKNLVCNYGKRGK
jgi:hypothetical protein